MTEPVTPSLPDSDTANPAQWQRLYPHSWLFMALQYLKSVIFPLLLLAFAHDNDNGLPWHFVPLIVLLATTAIAIGQYFTYRYRLMADGIEIRSGLLQRNLRQIPYARIHNVTVQQNLLHRLLGVAEARLESASGTEAEARMRVLRLEQALALEHLVRTRHGELPYPAASAKTTAAHALPPPLFAMSAGEIIRHGFVHHQGVVLAAAAVSFVLQLIPDHWLEDGIRSISPALLGQLFAHSPPTGVYALLFVIGSLFTIMTFMLLSVLFSLLRYHGFTLREQGRRLTLETGLFSRMRSSLPKRRIQSWQLREGPLHRLFDRRSLSVATAAGHTQGETQTALMNHLIPLAPPATCDALLRHWLPDCPWPPEHWQPLARHASWRIALPNSLLLLALLPLLYLAEPLLVLLLPAGLLLVVWLARKSAAASGWQLAAGHLLIRQGWWQRQWTLIEVDKLHSLTLKTSPLDRFFGMSTLMLDSIGTPPLRPLQIRYLPMQDARDLRDALARSMAQSRLTG